MCLCVRARAPVLSFKIRLNVLTMPTDLLFKSIRQMRNKRERAKKQKKHGPAPPAITGVMPPAANHAHTTHTCIEFGFGVLNYTMRLTRCNTKSVGFQHEELKTEVCRGQMSTFDFIQRSKNRKLQFKCETK